MTTAHHTAIPHGAPANAAVLEAPLSQLDAAIAAVIATGSGQSTTLTAQANAGQASLTVASSTGFAIGQSIYIGSSGGPSEARVVLTIPDATHITVSVNLTNTYASGKPVSASPVEIVDARGGQATLGARLSLFDRWAYDVRKYGATGLAADNASPAIQAAIAAAQAAGGGRVYLPSPGIYKCDSQLTIPGDNIGIAGDGWGSELRWGNNLALIVNSNTAVMRSGFTLQDLYYNGQSFGSSGLWKCENFSYSLVERVFLTSVGPTGIGIEFFGTGSTYHNTVRSCRFNLPTSGSTAIKWTAGAASPNANSAIDCQFVGAAGTTMIDIGVADAPLVLGCTAEGGATYNLRIRSGATSAKIAFTRFESGPVTIDAGANDTRLIGNSYAGSVVFTDNGTQTIRIADDDIGVFIQAKDFRILRGAAGQASLDANGTDSDAGWTIQAAVGREPYVDMLRTGDAFATRYGRAVTMREMTAPGAPAADSGTFFMRDNGSGKTQLCVIFATGAIQVIATQP